MDIPPRELNLKEQELESEQNLKLELDIELKPNMEFADENSVFHDYCLAEYVPNVDFKGKLKSSNILFKTFQIHDCNPTFLETVSKIRTKIGEEKVVWGYKKSKETHGWEYYFYNYEKRDNNVNIQNVLESLQNILPNKLTVSDIDKNKPYFMFSFDIDERIIESKEIKSLHLYFTSEDRPGGLSYGFTQDGLKLENHYAFFDAKNELDRIVPKIKNSPIIDFTKINLNKILLPELYKCKTICIANKSKADCIYYCGINIDQFLFFLNQFLYPMKIIEFIQNHKSELNHLQFDVGFDYYMENGQIQIDKSGFYGTF